MAMGSPLNRKKTQHSAVITCSNTVWLVSFLVVDASEKQAHDTKNTHTHLSVNVMSPMAMGLP